MADFNASLEILSRFLTAPERGSDCFNIHQIQGAMAAVLSCPEVISEVELGFLILGESETRAEEWFEDDAIRSAWITCLNTIDEDMALERFSLFDQYIEGDPSNAPTEAFSHWCDGYLHGYTLTEAAWQGAYAFLAEEGFEEMEEEHIAFLSMLVSISDWEQALKDNEDPERLKQYFPMLAKTINETVLQIHHLALTLEDFQIESEQETWTYVNEYREVGRNDPCPCGSGKKYKKCCLQ